ncbi:MAG TPA: type VI secretion system protein TssA [Pyrinomonadaceae bacterium]|jgi:type VI secretion system protein ImpA|nr:type VI secretion system protein TssA [Pyrinomonadaceae bacterium]
MNVLDHSRAIDLQQLLQPIPGANPAGESLRYEGTYDRIVDARREDDPALSQGIYKSNLKRADWTSAEAACVEALAKKSKDLQIAGWLLETWLHLYGLAGVTNGLSLLAGLCEQFWDDLYPIIDGNDLEGRVAPLDWIDQKLSLKLKQIPLTLPSETSNECYAYVDWESACHFENLAMKDPRALQEALAKINPSVATFRAAVAATDRFFYLELIEDLENAIHVCDLLEQILDEKCGKEAPSLRQFKEALCAIHQLISHDLHSRPEETESIDEEHEVSGEAGEPEFELWSAGPIRNRGDAYRRLSEAADYLLRTEPHSPTPYLVKRAVEWGTMSLPELLQQIVRNEGELNEIDRLLRLTGKRWPT